MTSVVANFDGVTSFATGSRTFVIIWVRFTFSTLCVDGNKKWGQFSTISLTGLAVGMIFGAGVGALVSGGVFIRNHNVIQQFLKTF